MIYRIIIFIIFIAILIVGGLFGFQFGNMDIQQKLYAKQLRLNSCVEDDARLFDEKMKIYEENLYYKEALNNCNVKINGLTK